MLRKSFIVLAVTVMIALPFTHDSGVGGIIEASDAAEVGKALQISDERGVKVTVILQGISSEAKTWDFQMTLETHTQDLSEDLSKSAVLIADGKKYLPEGWEGAPPGGHHRKGILRFKAIVPQPVSAELQLRLAGDASPRSFKWLLK